MDIFLPIKPKFAFAIAKGEKKYEFRKSNMGRNIKRVIVYASSPEKKIIGHFEVKEIHKASPSVLWKRFQEFSGIEKEAFFSYYKDSRSGVAIEIKRFIPLKRRICPKDIAHDFSIPQSFKYLSEKEFEVFSRS